MRQDYSNKFLAIKENNNELTMKIFLLFEIKECLKLIFSLRKLLFTYI